jgi:hypothetical protein
MAELPKGLKTRKRADGKLDIVGTNTLGEEYVARTTEQNGVTDFDLKILDIGSPEKRDMNALIGFAREQRDNARKAWEHSDDDLYMEGAEKVVRAGLHLEGSKVGYSRLYAQNWDRAFKEIN